MRNKIFSAFLLIVALCYGCGIGVASNIWVEAESFANKGGWSVDQQFVFEMGSPYLIAHGMGESVEDASTEVVFSKAAT